jgi:RNA polymerase sigma factor (sigma-70 family)
MTKTILFSNGDQLQMTFEEVREQFKPMVIRAMKRANGRFIYNAVEENDFMQELEIELWRAYEAYDVEAGNCFTTYLHYKLQKGVRNATYSRYSLKNQHNGLVSMNAAMGEDDLKLEDMFTDENDDSMEKMEVNELTAIIRSNVSTEEEELLQILLDKQLFSVQDYATKHGITRQAANQRVIKLKKKLQSAVKKDYLEII